MDDQNIQDIADRVIAALENLALGDPGIQIAEFGPLAVLAAAALATWAAMSTLKQKREADARSEWWRRTQWALEATISKNERMNTYGVEMLQILVESDMAGPGDKQMLDTVWRGTKVETDDGIDQLIEHFSALDPAELSTEELELLKSYAVQSEQAPAATDTKKPWPLFAAFKAFWTTLFPGPEQRQEQEQEQEQNQPGKPLKASVSRGKFNAWIPVSALLPAVPPAEPAGSTLSQKGSVDAHHVDDAPDVDAHHVDAPNKTGDNGPEKEDER